MGDKPLIYQICNIIQNKKDLGETQCMKNVEQRKTTGFITHEDIMRIERLKNELFPDYEFLNRVIDAQQDALKHKRRPPHIGSLITKDSNPKLYADNALIPMSYSGISDPQPIIFNKEKNARS